MDLKINGRPSSSYCGITVDANSTHVEEKGKGKVCIACFCLFNFIIPWCFKLTQLLLQNYIMCVYLNLEAMHVK